MSTTLVMSVLAVIVVSMIAWVAYRKYKGKSLIPSSLGSIGDMDFDFDITDILD